MKRRLMGIDYIIKYLVAILMVFNYFVLPEGGNIKNFIMFFLAFFLNVQIRHCFLKDKLLIASLIVDLYLIYQIQVRFSGLCFILILVTLIDSLLILEKESKVFFVVIGGFIIYYTKDISFEVLIFSIFIYILIFAYARELKELEYYLAKTNELYDANRKYSNELELSKRSLQDYARMVEYISRTEERNQISREIHDTTGHKLTGILMYLEASIKVSETDERKGREMIYSVRDNVRQCIDTLRQTLKKMKPKECKNNILMMRQMLDEFSACTGIIIEFGIIGDYNLFPSIEKVLYKNAQEAVTNAAKHSNASKINIVLSYSENYAELTVSDNGCGIKQINKGMGISGMEERTRLLGGKLIFNTGNGGLTVKTVIPISK